jgi:hypothetical protein
LLGTIGDQALAEQIGVSRGVIGAFRRKLGIAAYEGYKFLKGYDPRRDKEATTEPEPQAAGAPEAPTALAQEPRTVALEQLPFVHEAPAVAENEPSDTSRADSQAPPAEEVTPPTAAIRQRSRPRSKLTPFTHLFGTVPDISIANEAGVSKDAVRMARTRLGIPAWKGEAPVDAQAVVPAEQVKATDTARRAGRSKIGAYATMLGTVPDSTVAKLAHVTVAAVRIYRFRKGIPKWTDRRDADQEPVAPAEPTPAPVNPLDAARDDLGRVPDHVIAQRYGVTVSKVGVYRRKLGIAAYEGSKFQKAYPREQRQVAEETGVATPTVIETASDAGELPEAAPRASLRLPPRKTTGQSLTQRVEAFRDELGLEPDAVVGKRHGFRQSDISVVRRKLGIPSWASTHPAGGPASAAVATSPAPAAEEATSVAEKPVVAPPEPVELTQGPTVEPREVKAVKRTGFVVLARRGEQQRRFALVADGIVDAAARATELLAVQTDGTWRVAAIGEIAEVLE